MTPVLPIAHSCTSIASCNHGHRHRFQPFVVASVLNSVLQTRTSSSLISFNVRSSTRCGHNTLGPHGSALSQPPFVRPFTHTATENAPATITIIIKSSCCCSAITFASRSIRSGGTWCRRLAFWVFSDDMFCRESIVTNVASSVALMFVRLVACHAINLVACTFAFRAASVVVAVFIVVSTGTISVFVVESAYSPS